MSFFEEARRRAAEQQNQQLRRARPRSPQPQVSTGGAQGSMMLPGQGTSRPAPTASRGPKGFREMGDSTQSLMNTKAQMIRDAAKKKSAVKRSFAEKGLAADVGRSARQGGSGGRGSMLSAAGSDLAKDAANTAASAELDALDANLDAKKFEAEKYVSPADARNSVEAYIDSIEDNYARSFGDDEAGLADDLDAWADQKSSDGKPLHSANEISYARDQAKRLRRYENNFFTHTGGRKIGSM